MEKKTKKSQNPITSSQLKKNFGPSALQFSDDAASHLVGSIVEKGISDEPRTKPNSSPIPPPQPSVLPFPVARHRSHGPHWAPIGSVRDDENDSGLSDEEDKASMDFDQMSRFAHPVERKSKQVVDFKKWRELLSGNNTASAMAEKPERNRLGSKKSEKRKNDSKAIETLGRREDNKSCSVADMDLEFSNKVPISESDVEMKDHGSEIEKNEMPFTNYGVVSSGTSLGSEEQESTSLETQIDAENRARLQGMSPEEISEAQAEIMHKMDPLLLRLLKKRGEQKLKNQNSWSLDNHTRVAPLTNGQKNDDRKKAKTLPGSETKTASEDRQSEHENGEVRNPDPVSGGLWSTWNERVEGVRGLRFSLDGTVVENDTTHVADTGCVAERDFLRTEGDPGAAGYTIKEAVALTRSVIPGQRALALHMLFSALTNAIQNIYRGQADCSMRKDDKVNKFTDWEAIWAYALGPEPELVLSLRMCLDDNHNSVVLACTKVIQCILTCDVNENFLDVSEKATLKDICTAPVFRSRPEIDVGFIRGGFWKYNAKSSNILNLDEDIIDDEAEGKHTIQDDIVVAGQDFAAGLVRMGILPRLRYLIESDPTAALEECVVSVLVAIARHSPICAKAIFNCQRLVETVVQRFTKKDITKIHPFSIKSVSLIKVLAHSDRKNCREFLKSGIFLIMTRNLFKYPSSLDQWVNSGKDNCKRYSALMVEQLRLWKVFILHGYCVSYFSDIFPSLCLWLNPPSLEKLIENNVLGEYASISAESYLVLEALAMRLPNFFSHLHQRNQIEEHPGDDVEVWSWSQANPMVDSAVKWIVLMSDLNSHNFWLSRVWSGRVSQDLTSLLWLYSSVMSMLAEVLRRIILDDIVNNKGSGVPWLPEFVPKVGLEIIRNKFLSFSDDIGTKFATDLTTDCSFIEKLCYLRHEDKYQTSLASVCCLRKIIQTIFRVDHLIQSAKKGIQSSQEVNPSREDRILQGGIINGSLAELRSVQSTFTKLVALEWQFVQSIEIVGRGGLAPGVGVGWGASGGGFWSATVLLAQADSGLIVDVLEVFQVLSTNDVPRDDEIASSMQIINSSLAASLISGPRDRNVVEKAFKVLTHVSVLKYLDFSTRKFLRLNRTVNKLFKWEYKEEDFLLFNEILTSHFSDRWLTVKNKKVKATDSTSEKTKGSLDTIYEDSDTSNTAPVTSSVIEWAHQRLPLPVTWLLSPISTLCNSKDAGLKKCSNLEDLMHDPGDRLQVSIAGLFFLLGIETMSSFLPSESHSAIQSVPLVWKLHSLSVILLVGMDVIQESKSRDVYEALQDLYGDVLDKAKKPNSCEMNCEEPKDKKNLEFLRFQSEIHDSYSTFVETLVDQFSAISYGDLIYGRQVAIYLHRCVEANVRLAVWNSLSNFRVLGLLPPLDSCIGEAEGYLQPIEEKAEILEAYVKSWTSDALDRAANRGSVAYTLILHHLSHFIFLSGKDDKQLLRNKLARSLLRDFSLKPQHQAMMLKLLRYDEKARSHINSSRDSLLLDSCIDKRLQVLAEACERNSSLLNEVNKLKSLVQDSYA